MQQKTWQEEVQGYLTLSRESKVSLENEEDLKKKVEY